MAYIGNSPGVASQRIVTDITATEGQTTFSPSNGYTLGYVDVYLNGVLLVDGTDYTADNNTSVVLTTGAAVGDNVTLITYLPRGLTDGYLKSEVDALINNIDALPDQTGHSGQFLTTDGTNPDWASVDALPDQTDNSGKYLTTDGSDASWAEINTGAGYFLGENGATGDTVNGLGDIFRVHEDTLDTAVTIAVNTNASATGPLTLNAPVTVNGTLTIV